MATKKSKEIKQIKKQLKKLNARMDDMSRELKGLQNSAVTRVTEPITAGVQEESGQGTWPDQKFSANEVEIAGEMAEDAEEVGDILEKKGR